MIMKQNPSERLPALDSLRGIASFIVLLGHCYMILPDAAHANVPLWVSFMPLRLLFSSYAAVIMFFVLSGYVLSIPFLCNERLPYSGYLIKRICRIYLPFACAVLVAATLHHFCAPLADGQGSSWFRKAWPSQPTTISLILRHLAMTGVDDDMWLDGVMWTLVYELRISILFPLLVLLGKKPRFALALTVILYVAAVAASMATGNAYALQSAEDIPGTFLLMLRFMSFFIIGTTLARHNAAIKAWLDRLPRGAWLGLLLLSLFLFTVPPEIHNERLKNMLPMFNSLDGIKFAIEFMLGIASGFLIISARNVKSFSNLLTAPPFLWLGKVSYSLYLTHIPIAYFIFRALLGKINFVYITALAVAASLIGAEIFYLLVERPAMRLGRALAKRSHDAHRP
jgi:peptidoglycan/LPS O-acetylase OafA/YrhL